MSEPATKVPWWTLSDEDLLESIQAHDPPITAVLDTNVLVEIYACHDVLEAHATAHAKFKASPELHTSLGDMDVIFDPKFQSRLRRVRESLFLAQHLHKIRATTFSLRGEFEAKLEALVPVDPVGPDVRRQLFTGTFVHFVHENVLGGWNPIFEGVAGSHAKGEADRVLLRFAKVGNLPLITNEGRKTDGSIDWSPKKIPALAKAMGVRACSPGEFYGKIDEAAERDEFLALFDVAASRYVSSLPNENERLIWQGLVRHVQVHYNLILMGPGAPDLSDGFETVPTQIA